MGKTKKVKIEKLDPIVTNIDFTWSEADTVFSAVLRLEPSIFKTGNDERVRLLNKLWKNVRPRTKEEALWNEHFRAKMDQWGISYAQDLIDLDIPEDITDDEDDEY